jgi:hypothetical protein
MLAEVVAAVGVYLLMPGVNGYIQELTAANDKHKGNDWQ